MSVRPHSAARNNTERLAVRRRKQRRRVQVVGAVLFFVLLGTGIYGLWRPGVRISHITVEGTGMPLDMIATKAMEGSYLGIIPRNSILFFPSSSIRSDILAAHPGVAALSIARAGLSSISLKVNERVPIARWCGVSSEAFVGEGCYLFDANGFVYATATLPGEVELSAEKPLTPFILFGSLIDDGIAPIGATLKNADKFPAVFDFARQVGSSGSPIHAIVIRNDEVDFFISATGARITYLLGDAQNAFTALVSAKGNMDLSDPELQYVDLRFPGKVYLKKRDAK
ncbi:MAG: hypothetical protein Q7T37_00180 [bacterium]|nr:hypothetical protein [bacterium]MDO8742738.1 hypothetical protein [bacterium]